MKSEIYFGFSNGPCHCVLLVQRSPCIEAQFRIPRQRNCKMMPRKPTSNTSAATPRDGRMQSRSKRLSLGRKRERSESMI